MASPPEDSRYDHPEKWTHSHSLPVDLCGPELLSKARILAETQFGSCKTRGPDSLGFLLGSSGVFALNAVIARSLWQGEESEEKFLTLFRNCCQDLLAPDPLGCGSDEVETLSQLLLTLSPADPGGKSWLPLGLSLAAGSGPGDSL